MSFFDAFREVSEHGQEIAHDHEARERDELAALQSRLKRRGETLNPHQSRRLDQLQTKEREAQQRDRQSEQTRESWPTKQTDSPSNRTTGRRR
jgi:hypothetical protein